MTPLVLCIDLESEASQFERAVEVLLGADGMINSRCIAARGAADRRRAATATAAVPWHWPPARAH
jgi:hypothetical protein